MIVLGLSNVGEGVTGLTHPAGEGFNLTKEAIQVAFKTESDTAVKLNAVVNLSADLATLNVPHAIASRAALSRAFANGAPIRVISPTPLQGGSYMSVPSKYDSSSLGVILNSILEANTVLGAVSQ